MDSLSHTPLSGAEFSRPIPLWPHPYANTLRTTAALLQKLLKETAIGAGMKRQCPQRQPLGLKSQSRSRKRLIQQQRTEKGVIYTRPRYFQSRRSERRSVRFLWMMRCRRLCWQKL